jgi:hypothetical protein
MYIFIKVDAASNVGNPRLRSILLSISRILKLVPQLQMLSHSTMPYLMVTKLRKIGTFEVAEYNTKLLLFMCGGIYTSSLNLM